MRVYLSSIRDMLDICPSASKAGGKTNRPFLYLSNHWFGSRGTPYNSVRVNMLIIVTGSNTAKTLLLSSTGNIRTSGDLQLKAADATLMELASKETNGAPS
jgi:hypothetical protein